MYKFQAVPPNNEYLFIFKGDLYIFILSVLVLCVCVSVPRVQCLQRSEKGIDRVFGTGVTNSVNLLEGAETPAWVLH